MRSLRFSARSLRSRASSIFGLGLLIGMVACGGAGDESASSSQTPAIIGAPANREAIVGQRSSFFVEGQGVGLAFAWEEQPGGSGEWRTSSGSVTSDGFASNLVVGPVDIGMDKTRFRGRVSNSAGSVLSAEARMDVVWGTVSTLEPNSIDFGAGSGGFGSADGGTPGGGDGEGAGVGGGLGKTPRATTTVTRAADGAPLGGARAGATSGLVRVKAGPGAAPVVITLNGNTDATYYDEGRDAMLPLASNQELHALALAFDRHLGVTTLTEAGWRYALNHFLQDPDAVRAGSVPVKRSATAEELARLTPQQIQLANEAIRSSINRLLPPRYALDSISTLPAPVDDTSPRGSITDNAYGRMQAVVGGLALAAARFEPSLANPALTMNEQLADDLTDGVVDGVSLDRRSVFGAPGSNAYGPDSLARFLSDAADAQFERFGDGSIESPPVITVQPVSAVITDGGTASLSVVASGSRLVYQWFRNDSAIDGQTRPALSTSQAGAYHVVVSNGASTVTSDRVAVTVVPAMTAPSIITQPQPGAIALGHPHTMTVEATGANLVYQWWYSDGYSAWWAITGADSATYTADHAGNYFAEVTGVGGTVRSREVYVSLATRPSITGTSWGCNGLGCWWSVSAAGTAPFTYQWFRREINGGLSKIIGATSATYYPTDCDTYFVQVSNIAGADMNTNGLTGCTFGRVE